MMMMVMRSTEKMKKRPPKDSLTLLPCFYFVELPIVASSMVSLYFLELTDVLQPPLVGFRCYDRQLSKPYVDGGDELIPLLMLMSLAFAGPAASIMLLEALLYCLQSRLKLRTPEGSITAGGCSFNSFLRRTVRFVGVHVFGLCATALVTDVIQLSTGHHAPFFLTVCKPNYTLAPGSCDSNAFITRDICSGHDQHAILAARKSFPSQHATLSAFAAVYVSMYFNSTISDSTKLLKPLLVFGFVIAAALTGLTQITQHRSHPVDVYVGFLIGAFIAAYLALHAVANFKSPDDVSVALPPAPPKEDPLRMLTERGHHSVYNKGPASASESHDEITAATGVSGGPVPPPPLDRLEALGPIQREQDSMGSLKRASVDVELLAPRSPMGKETMLTFSHTLPRASINIAPAGSEEVLHAPVQPVQPVQRRLKAVQVPVDPMRSQQLMTEWKQRSLEMRGLGAQDQALEDHGLVGRNHGGWDQGLGGQNQGLIVQDRGPGGQNQDLGVQDQSLSFRSQDLRNRNQVLGGRDQGDVSEDGSDEGSVGEGGAQTSRGRGGRPPSRNATLPPGTAKAVATPRPPQTSEAGPPPVSPKSAVTRAKWLAIREKAGGTAAGTGRSSQPPRLMQVVALSKQQGLLPPHSPSPSSSSGTASSSSGSASSTESPRYQQREGEGGAIITVDAHAPHHPVVQAPLPPQAPPLTGNGGPWEWAGPREPYDLSSSSFRPQRRAASPRAAPIPLPPDLDLSQAPPNQAPPTQVAMRRKTALVLMEREGAGPGQQDHYYLQGPQGRRYKD